MSDGADAGPLIVRSGVAGIEDSHDDGRHGEDRCRLLHEVTGLASARRQRNCQWFDMMGAPALDRFSSGTPGDAGAGRRQRGVTVA